MVVDVSVLKLRHETVIKTHFLHKINFISKYKCNINIDTEFIARQKLTKK